MKKILLTILVALLLVGCAKADVNNTEAQKPNANTTESEMLSTENVQDTEVKDSEASDSESENTGITDTETQNSETPSTEVTDSETTESETVEKKEFTYKDLDKKMYAKSSVNVRDLPNKDGKKLGGLSTAEEVHVTGQCNETSWYRIEYKGGIAYVSNSYLVDTKPDKPQPEDPVEPSEPDNPDPDDPYVPREDEIVTYGKWRFNRAEMGGWESDIKRLAESGYGVIIDCTNFQGCAILVSSYDDATYEANKEILKAHVNALGYEVGQFSMQKLSGCLDTGVYVVMAKNYFVEAGPPEDW